MRRPASAFHFAYLAAVVIKGLDGAIETVAGLITTIAGPWPFYSLAVWVTAPELSSHPENRAAHLIRHGASNLAHAPGRFVAVYLLAHGVIKLALAINLLRGRNWIFPVATVLLLGFIGYMAVRLAGHWSAWLLAFALFDVLTVGLVVNEWRRHDPQAFAGVAAKWRRIPTGFAGKLHRHP
ncbi:MAG TPA: DUF2127 domain-containing protein [Rhizomicrobium sp.]|nr:DUF2127 domain-containing protein [Rhizomicrobium sp.]